MPSKKKPRGKRAVTIRAAENSLKKDVPKVREAIAQLKEARKVSAKVFDFHSD